MSAVADVARDSTITIELRVAHVADLRLPRMSFNVFDQAALRCIPGLILRAFERPLPGVHPNMIIQAPAVSERPRAMRAREVPRLRSSLVSVQKVQLKCVHTN